MLRQTVTVFVASRPCIVYAMICYVCVRPRIMSETSFRKTWKALQSFIVTARKMTGCGMPTFESLLYKTCRQ